ncbi:MAG: polysaccharide export protein [Chlorobi bacterium]|nr:polysaccharide export protein [Chlorobiota bacterium]
MKPQLKIFDFFKISALFTIVLLSSCASRQNIVYFQDEPLSAAIENSNSNFELHYKTDDLLTINVSALDPKVARPFNLEATYTTQSVIDGQGVLLQQTYLIDSNGNIEFPVLGTIKLGGMSRTEATANLKGKLSEYIKNPIVNIRLANFTISILGEVTKPGTYTIQDERISLPQALGLAGDLTIYGRRDNVFLIREVNGEKKFTKFDLTSVNVLNSSNYYLTQNDVIYVEPNNAKVGQSAYNNGVILSVVGILATVAAILIR